MVQAAMVVAILTVGSITAESGGPLPAQHALAEDGQMVLSPTDRCPVCAMFPARHARSAAAMRLNNGVTFYFCSNGCLLRTWLRPAIYIGAPQTTIHQLVVRDYFSGRNIDARRATWIAGSDVIGPMGPAIVALGDANQKDTFVRRHGGRMVFAFDQIDDRLWRQISHRTLPDKQQP